VASVVISEKAGGSLESKLKIWKLILFRVLISDEFCKIVTFHTSYCVEMTFSKKHFW
jgi:hypothetical protein